MQEEINSAADDSKIEGDDSGLSRRGALECMVWAGTGILWTVLGGVPKSVGLLGDAVAAVPTGFSFLQISDSHIGFNKPANPDAVGTLREAIGKAKAVKSRFAFMIHTGDITHLSKPDEFDNAEQVISEAKLNVHYVPGEHDFIDEGVGKAYLDRYGKGTKGQGWYSFDDHGVHFIGLVNVVDLKAGGLWAAWSRPTRLAHRRSQGQVLEHTNRCVRPHPALDRVCRLGLGHR